jgi:hypothetical protein
MSEVKRGIIGMPLHLAMSSDLSRMQFHACALQVFDENVRLSEQVAALQAAPDSWQSGYDEGRKMGTKTALSERDQFKAEKQRLQSAAKTLSRMGYTDNGGELWKPPLGKKPDFDLIDQLRAEIERLQRFETAYKEFSDKTDWVQETAHWSELGMHRADVLRKRCDDLTSHNQAQADEIVRLRKERDELVIELPEEQPMYMFYAPDVVAAIEAAGVKVKP